MADIWTETVELTEEQRLVKRNIQELCADFDAEYWRERDAEGEYPHEFLEALGEHGWLGILIPEEYGGAGMETTEAVVMMEQIARQHGGGTAAQAIHGAVYNSRPIVRYGSESLKEELLPKLATGEEAVQSLALTEPDAGSDSLAIDTFAERDGDEYVINGSKVWISRVNVTDYLLIIARTTPAEEAEKRTRGISMFLADVDEAREAGTLEMEAIPKTVVPATPSYELWFEDLRVPEEHLIGEEGNGFYQLLDGLNEERLVVAAENVGLGELALDRAVDYANQREVFDRLIGSNQAIQHPLAKAYAHVQAAKQTVYNAAPIVDEVESSDRRGGALANMAKFLSAEACYEAADAAVQTHGGFGVAREYDVERYLREARFLRIAPVAQELTLNYLGERVLGLPRSY
ncbi:MAG: acyl-CoA dehydrogenase family protein [Halobacteriales archaeon]